MPLTWASKDPQHDPQPFFPSLEYCRQCSELSLQSKATGSPFTPLKTHQRDIANVNERRNILYCRRSYSCLPEQHQWQSEEHYSVHQSNFGYLIFVRPKGQQF